MLAFGPTKHSLVFTSFSKTWMEGMDEDQYFQTKIHTVTWIRTGDFVACVITLRSYISTFDSC